MKINTKFNLGMAVLLAFVMLWTFSPTLASVLEGDGVPIWSGTDAGAIVAQAEDVPVDEPVAEDGVFIPYTLFNALCVFIGTVIIGAFLASPPWVQNILPSILDVARSTLEYLKNKPGDKYDSQIEQLIKTVDEVKKRLPAKPTDPPVSADGIPYTPPY